MHIRNNIITRCKSAHLIFQMKKPTHAAFYKYLILTFLHFTLRESPIIRCDSCLYFKGIMRRKHKRMLVHVNQLDLNWPNAISTVS